MPGLAETVRVLSISERLLSVAVAGVLAAGTMGAAAVDRPAVEEPVASSAPSPSPAAASPSPEPSLSPSPAPAPLVQAKPAPPAPAPPEPPQAGCPVPKRPGAPGWTAKPLAPPVVAESDLPAPMAAGKKAPSLEAVSGKGFWVTNFAETPVDVPAIVAKAQASGLRNIWVRTGGKQGYYGDRFLPELVPAAHAAGLTVVAWDFPYLSDPVADAERARRAFADGIDAFAPDIETTAEGTYATAPRVALYLSLVRSYAGEKPVAATVPRPTPLRRTSFPYQAFVPYADLFVPMVYWSCNEPGALVQQSLTELGALLPVAPAGQGYDMGDEGGRRGVPTRAETWRFLDVAHRGGAVGASIWTVERMGDGQLDALSAYPWTGRS
jgi:hypothetical protein